MVSRLLCVRHNHVTLECNSERMAVVPATDDHTHTVNRTSTLRLLLSD